MMSYMKGNMMTRLAPKTAKEKPVKMRHEVFQPILVR